MQLLTLALNGDISLWDAQKMQVLQTVKNKQNMNGASQLSSSFFCKDSGTILLATSTVFMWQMKEDYQTMISNE